MQWKISEATKSWSVSRLCLWFCPGRHAKHRAHIAAVLAGRSLAACACRTCLLFGSDRAVLDCLDSLQPAEQTQRELGSSLADAEWSAAAAKLASQSSVAGGTVRMLGAKHECKYPLCDAGFCHAQAASLGVILLCPGRGEASRPWKGNCATRRADQSVVVPTHSKAEERSDEKFNRSSRDSGHLFFDA